MSDPTRQKILNRIKQIEHPKQVYELVTTYLRQRLQEANGEITASILKDADAFYDHSGLPTRIADALGISLGELRKILGRKRHITCQRCGRTFTVLARRRIGGYSKLKRWLCDECRAKEREEIRERKRQQRAREEAARQRRIEVDRQIARLACLGEDPLTLDPLRSHLADFARLWRDREATIWTDYRGFQVGPGCMLCGRSPVRLFIMREEAAENQPKSNLWEAAYESPSPGWPPVVSIYQALWRITPWNYFRVVRWHPFLSMPVLILCESCGEYVTARGTHRKVRRETLPQTKG